MKRILQSFLDGSLLLLYSIGPIFVPVPTFAQRQGRVDCILEWHSGRQTYTYVFSGVVSSQGRPCPNAKIQLQFSTPSQPDLIQETVASANGTYELKVSVAGNPQDSADWKLVAQAPETSAALAGTTEIDGRAILTEDENTVVVERPIQLQG